MLALPLAIRDKSQSKHRSLILSHANMTCIMLFFATYSLVQLTASHYPTLLTLQLSGTSVTGDSPERSTATGSASSSVHEVSVAATETVEERLLHLHGDHDREQQVLFVRTSMDTWISKVAKIKGKWNNSLSTQLHEEFQSYLRSHDKRYGGVAVPRVWDKTVVAQMQQSHWDAMHESGAKCQPVEWPDKDPAPHVNSFLHTDDCQKRSDKNPDPTCTGFHRFKPRFPW